MKIASTVESKAKYTFSQIRTGILGTKAQRKPASKIRFMPAFFVPSCLCVPSIRYRNSEMEH
jgi:hypothetical protein